MKYISLIFLFVCSVIWGSEKQDTKLFFNIGLNYNMHSANIKGFSGFENCCDEFTGGNSFAPHFGAGLELGLGRLIAEIPTTYVVQLNYNDLSSEYSEERFRGYKINEFDKEEIIVEHQLNPKISLISVGNSIYGELFDKFSFGIGADIGFAITSDFSQTEVAKSPDSFKFSNGERQINTGEGTIEEMNSLIFSFFTGIRYDLFSYENLDLRPELKYNYIPGSLLDGKDLTVSQLSGSISFVYNFVEKVEPPPTPPMPVDLTPPDTVKMPPPPTINVDLLINDQEGNNITDSQIIELPTTVYETKQEYALKPVVFFDSSDYDYKQYNIESFTNIDFDVQSQMINAIAYKMNSNRNLKVNLITYDLSDEQNDIGSKRLELISSKLVEYGVEKQRINSKIIAMDKEFKYNELKQEYRRVDLNLSDNSELIKSVYEISNRIEYDDMTFTPKSTVVASRDDYSKEMDLFVNDDKVRTEEDDFVFKIDQEYYDELKKNNPIDITYSASAQVVGIYDSERISFKVQPTVKSIKQTLNTLEYGSETVEQHILGYTEFDKANFTSTDDKVLSLVRNALNNGKKVTLYASTDNLGDAEYNRALAERRANFAKNLIGGNVKNIEVIFPKDYLFSNEHPYGRMLNRAIVVRIEN